MKVVEILILDCTLLRIKREVPNPYGITFCIPETKVIVKKMSSSSWRNNGNNEHWNIFQKYPDETYVLDITVIKKWILLYCYNFY